MSQQTKETQGGMTLSLTPEKIQSQFELSIALALHTWPALTLAVQNSWGGPQSSEKRDWLAGAVSELIESSPDADVEYVEEFLLQVMIDEFDTNIEDGSGEDIAAQIVGLRKLTLQGDFTKINEMYTKWQEKQSKGGHAVAFQHVEEDEEEDDDTELEGNDMEEDDTEDSTEEGQTSQVTRISREKFMPNVDEEGFIEVIGRKQRR